MDTNDVQYLNSIDDVSQYPAARCAVGPNIYIYHHSSLSGIEAIMNVANKEIRARTVVDLLNVCLLLIKFECDRFESQQKMAWDGESILTL